ncbi:hypothetical protein FEM48_Zijuj11G0054800 [Ziziphus jujuba var. spinosa]|uniref:Auxin-responsive protein SAUR36-like n=1 Tax=Ziziphus jujuba var. spinosa TaxID=714518 RepID=A0A978UH35_ZIZJJ|nr:hypothetical protein FEM48_Zijuj11G0054800 [Ziziphus jujuba var. spinosa]
MRKARGFKLGCKLVKIYKWVIRHRRKPTRTRYQCLDPPGRESNPMSKFLTLARYLRRGAKELCFPKSGYIRVGHDPVETKPVGIPKGHLAVYVGVSQDETQRYLVPVIYFNHPLFGELLKEAEKVYGFNQPGRIIIPCGISEFEKVQTRIASGKNFKRCHGKRRQNDY